MKYVCEAPGILVELLEKVPLEPVDPEMSCLLPVVIFEHFGGTNWRQNRMQAGVPVAVSALGGSFWGRPS